MTVRKMMDAKITNYFAGKIAAQPNYVCIERYMWGYHGYIFFTRIKENTWEHEILKLT